MTTTLLKVEEVQTLVRNDVEVDAKLMDSFKSLNVEEVAHEKLHTVVTNEAEIVKKTIKSKDSFTSNNVNYCIRNHQGDVLYEDEGIRKSHNILNSKSFIEAKSSQTNNIHDLIEISSSTSYIVTPILFHFLPYS